MKPLKTFGLYALAALMAMALIGVASTMASSTQLCNTDPKGGQCTSVLSHLHEVSIPKVILETSILTTECDALFLTDTGGVGALGAPQTITGRFSYSNCTNSCTITEETPPATEKVLKITGHEIALGTLSFEIHVNCPGENCYYGGSGLQSTRAGPLLSEESNGEVTLVEQGIKKTKGLFCPSQAFLTFSFGTLSPFYIGT